LRFQVLTAANMKMAVFWVATQCSLVEFYQRFRGPCCHESWVIALMMVAASTSETSVNFYQTTRRNNPEDSHLQSNKLTGPYKHTNWVSAHLTTLFHVHRSRSVKWWDVRETAMCGMTRSWPIIRHYPSIRLEELRERLKPRSGWPPSVPVFDPGTSRIWAGLPATRPRHTTNSLFGGVNGQVAGTTTRGLASAAAPLTNGEGQPGYRPQTLA
jgi:hypothetical protein